MPLHPELLSLVEQSMIGKLIDIFQPDECANYFT